MAFNLQKSYSEAPPWARGVLLVGGTALVLGTAYVVYSYIKRKMDEAEANKAGKAAQAEADALRAQGVKPTLNDTTLENMSQALIEAFNGCGTDETAVYNVFKQLGNELDALNLIKVFAIRYYEPCAATNPGSYAIWLWNDKSFGGDLPAYINSELSASEKQKVNDILASKGITLQF